jgi:ABC-type transporter Mla subunit MlaD
MEKVFDLFKQTKQLLRVFELPFVVKITHRRLGNHSPFGIVRSLQQPFSSFSSRSENTDESLHAVATTEDKDPKKQESLREECEHANDTMAQRQLRVSNNSVRKHN